MQKRIVAISCAVVLLLASTIGRITHITFSGNYTVSSGYNSYSLTVSRLYETVYDRNMNKLNNNRKTLVAVIKPTQNCMNELNKLFTQKEIKEIAEELSNGKPVVKEIQHYASTKYIKIFEITKSNDCLLSKMIKNTDEISYEMKINFTVDAKGRILEGDAGTVEKTVDNLKSGTVLTVDENIQQAVEEAAQSIKKGAVVVMDVETSQILALYSTPNDYLNRSLNPYSVGSVFKLIASACALENNINPEYNCTGSITVGDTTFSCLHEKAHGKQAIKEALANSCNTYFVNLALTLGSERLLSTASSFGFGGEISLTDNITVNNGNLPSASELESKGLLALFGFGQGSLTASPLAFCSAVCAIANGGIYNQPSFILGKADENGTLSYTENREEGARVISQETSVTLQEYMRYVVTNGTASSAEYDNNSAGKTSTAQSGVYENGKEVLNTWFAGFYPYSNPKYSIVVLTEDGTTGSENCCPVFRSIVEKISKL